MAVLPSHIKPQSKEDFIDTWCSRGRMAVPTGTGGLIDVQILTFAETTLIDGQEAHLLIEARATRGAPVKRFGVAFTSYEPSSLRHLPLLWMNSAFEANWVLPGGRNDAIIHVSREEYFNLSDAERARYTAGPKYPLNIEDATCVLPASVANDKALWVSESPRSPNKGG